MATTGFDLTAAAWTSLGTTPCTVQLLSDDCLLIVDTVAPAALPAEPAALVLQQGGETIVDIQVASQNVYARGYGGAARVVVVR